MSTLTGIVISSSSVYVFESCHLMFCECEFSVCNDKNWTIVDSPFYVLCLALLSIVQRSWSAQEARMLHHLSSKCAHEMLVDHFHNTGTLIDHYSKLWLKQCKERKCQAIAHNALDFLAISTYTRSLCDFRPHLQNLSIFHSHPLFQLITVRFRK